MIIGIVIGAIVTLIVCLILVRWATLEVLKGLWR